MAGLQLFGNAMIAEEDGNLNIDPNAFTTVLVVRPKGGALNESMVWGEGERIPWVQWD